jgi:hypothetical protein
MWQSEESEDPRTSFVDSQPSATQAERIRQYDGVQQSRYGAVIADYGQQQIRRERDSGSGFGRGQEKGTAEDYGKRSGRGQEIYGLPQRQEFPQDIPRRADDSSFPLPDNRQLTHCYTAGYTETKSGARSGYPGLSDYDIQPNQATNSPGYGNQPSAESVTSYTAYGNRPSVESVTSYTAYGNRPSVQSVTSYTAYGNQPSAGSVSSYSASRSYKSPPRIPLSSLASAFMTTGISGSLPGPATSPLERGSIANGSKNTRHLHAVSGVSTEKLDASESMEYSDLDHSLTL